MEKSKDFPDRRVNKRAKLDVLVVGILNSAEPEIMGSVVDISLGGVKLSYSEQVGPQATFQTIDLIAGDSHIGEIPCRKIWEYHEATNSFLNVMDGKHCGIKFDTLSPDQIFQLRSFINRCTSPEISTFNSPSN